MATIKYNGMDLEEVTTPQIFDPPQMCVVQTANDEPVEELVVAILAKSSGQAFPVMSKGWRAYERCALLPEKPAPRRATWEQLAYWLIDGKGLVLDADTNRVDTGVYFDMKNMHEEVGERWYVMARGESMWHEPTVDYMGLEEA